MNDPTGSHQVTVAQVHAVAEGLVADIKAKFPGIRDGTATSYLLAMIDVMRETQNPVQMAVALRKRITEAADRRDPWALDVERAAEQRLEEERGKA